jgi:hypothetical protein
VSEHTKLIVINTKTQSTHKTLIINTLFLILSRHVLRAKNQQNKYRLVSGNFTAKNMSQKLNFSQKEQMWYFKTHTNR